VADYAKVNLREVENLSPRFGLSGMEARFPKRELGSELGAVSLQRLEPNVRQPFGHRHEQQEEHYLVLEGAGRINLDGDVIDLRPWDLVRIPAPVMRALEAGPDGLEFVVFGAPLGEPQAAITEEGWWGD
jgi:mannose-6-phosphate isomerase-like protein (cupin superfamily)